MKSSPSKGHRRKEGTASALTPVAVVVLMVLLCTMSYMLGKGQLRAGGDASFLQGSATPAKEGGFLIAEGGLKVLDTADGHKAPRGAPLSSSGEVRVRATDSPGSSKGSSEVAAPRKKVDSSSEERDRFVNTAKKPAKTPDASVDMTTETIIQQVTSLHSKLMTSLQFMTNTANKEALKFNAISNSDIHITHKLANYFRDIVRNVTNSLDNHSPEEQRRSVMELQQLMQGGHQCTSSQAAVQETIAATINMDICSEVEWYKVVQLAWPGATSFLDVGANKGYLGSLFAGLWGGGGLGISPRKTFELSKRLDVWPKSRNPAGFCKDGLYEAAPLYCPVRLRSAKTGECLHRRDNVQVYSIDGSSYITATMNALIGKGAEQGSGERLNWRYFNYAMSDTIGTARFTKQSRDNNAGFEGGSIRRDAIPSDAATEEVNMTTVDHFLRERNIQHLDVLKIDAEGQDNRVIFGASGAIRSSVALLTFEAGRGVQFLAPMVAEMDALGYSCYSTSRAGLFNGCMSEEFIRRKDGDKGNVFCASRRRAPMATLTLDLMSFPMLLQQEFTAKELETPSAIDAKRAFVNIKGFCSPWPKCAAL